jgi:hypothetical protein
MANALETVADYVTQARVLLQDTYGPSYRYSSLDIVQALNLGLQRARQVRADLFLLNDGAVPFYTDEDATPVPFSVLYRQGLLNWIVGQIQLRDAEDTTDARSAALQNSFITQLNPALLKVGE